MPWLLKIVLQWMLGYMCLFELWFFSGYMGFPGGASGKELPCQCRRHKRRMCDPWVGVIPLEEGVAAHSSILACSIPWTEAPGGLQTMRSQRVRHDWSDLARSGYVPHSETARSCGSSGFGLIKERPYCSPQRLFQFTFPSTARRVPFSPHPLQHFTCRFFDDGHTDWYEVIRHYSFDLHFSNN